VRAVAPAAIPGGDGNQEYFAWLRHAGTPQPTAAIVDQVAEAMAMAT
jgi:hypothetical protein